MTALSDTHRAGLTRMLRQCSDRELKRLGPAVSRLPGPEAAVMGQMVRDETDHRRRRDLVLGPILPMFAPRADEVEGLHFPAAVLPALWQAATAREARWLDRLDAEDRDAELVAGRIRQAAAAILRDRPNDIWPPSLEPERREDGLAELAGCLDLMHLARPGVEGLHAWVRRPDGDQVAVLRLLLRDAAVIAPDGARRLLEIWFAHLNEAPLILRVVAHSAQAAAREAFLSESELADFVERLLAAVDRRVARLDAFQPEEDLAGIETLGVDLAWCAGVLAELDLTLKLRPGSAWGRNVRDARARVADRLAGLMRLVERTVDTVLPTEQVRLVGRMTRPAPRLDIPAKGDAIDRTAALLKLLTAVRGVTSAFGCESERRQVVDRLTERLMSHADAALEALHVGDGPEGLALLDLLETVAGFMTALQAETAARTVRRRAAAAARPASNPSPAVA